MTATAFTLAGVDGCKGGWIAVLADDKLRAAEVRVFPGFAGILHAYPSIRVVAVDIPIGLLDAEPGERVCDKEARVVLKRPRSSSVFPAPRRFLLGVTPYARANALSTETVGKGLSAQTYNITPKVREVDQAVQKGGLGLVKEVHPEVSFWAMNGQSAMRSNKKGAEGRGERRHLLLICLSDRFVQRREEAMPSRATAGLDDLYDALAVLWSARRIAEGKSKRLPDNPETDACGLAMEINY